MLLRFLIFAVLLTAFTATCKRVEFPPPYEPECLVGKEDPFDETKSYEVPWFDVDLDAPAKERWKHVVRPFKNEILAVFDVLAEFFTIIPGIPIWDLLSNITRDAMEKGMIMQPYRDEVEGIAEELGCDLGHLTFLNLFYEMSRFCTSIVAQTADNKDLYHARNLDFGQFFMWNIQSKTWGLSEALKRVTINVNFNRGGKLLFKASTLAGHVGALTAMMPYRFSLSMNAKVEPDLREVIAWYNGNRPNVDFVMYFDRWLFENCDSFECAHDMISKKQFLSGAYFILGGNQTGQGTVMVRNRTDVQFERKLFDGDNDWFVLQTNYDVPEKDPLYLDDRQDPGERCMRAMGPNGVSLSGIYTVLSSKPTLNLTTVHTILMSVTKNIFMAFLQKCPQPCWAF